VLDRDLDGAVACDAGLDGSNTSKDWTEGWPGWQIAGLIIIVWIRGVLLLGRRRSGRASSPEQGDAVKVCTLRWIDDALSSYCTTIEIDEISTRLEDRCTC
jgi:hypothetical protein